MLLEEFMGHSFSLEEETQGEVQEFINLQSFQNLSSLEVNKRAGNKEFFKQGEVGDLKNHLTPEILKNLELQYNENKNIRKLSHGIVF